mmetsp:Transcript_5207/g.15031  ORF Transcript_5207/g.15031 Transcript_5207/m.15031 type:complete len:219 (-) Transcript_5207:725-1381(-)
MDPPNDPPPFRRAVKSTPPNLDVELISAPASKSLADCVIPPFSFPTDASSARVRSVMASMSASDGRTLEESPKTQSKPNFKSESISLVDRPPTSSPSPSPELPRLTIWSRYSFFCARSTILSSMVPEDTKRYTCTVFFWPMRCTRAWACRSDMGFQSLSKRMHVSAVWRLIPIPPERVDMRKMKYSESGVLNWLMRKLRRARGVLPSKRQSFHPRMAQ